MEPIWEQIKETVRGTMGPDSFQRWIAPLRFVDRNERSFVVGCPNSFFKKWVADHYGGRLQDAIQEATDREVRLHLRVQPITKECSPRKVERQMHLGQLSSSHLWNSGINGNYTFERYVVGPCNEFAYKASLEVARSPKTLYNPLLLVADVGLGKSHLSSAVGNHIHQHNKEERVCYRTAEEFINEMVGALKEKGPNPLRELWGT